MVLQCVVTYRTSSIPVKSGVAGKELGLIYFNEPQNVYKIMKMISHGNKSKVQSILSNFPEKFQGLGKLNNYQI